MHPKVLDAVIEAHGGLARWQSVDQIVARVDVRGWMFAAHGLPYAYPDVTVRVWAHEVRTEIRPMGPRGETAVYRPDRVELGSLAREAPRQRMGTTHLLWDWLDMTYFAGFAFWNYFTTPFCFLRPGFEVAELPPRDGLVRLSVTFPPDLPSHCRRQVFYFGDDLLLRRFDYVSEPIGQWVRVAHMCGQHRRMDGLSVPTQRSVYPRLGALRLPAAPGIHLHVKDVVRG